MGRKYIFAGIILAGISVSVMGAETPATQPSGAAEEVRAALSFRDAAADDVLAFIARTYDVVVLQDEAMPLKITVETARPATRMEAVAALNDALATRGFAVAVRVGQQSGRVILQVSAVTDVKQQANLTTGTDPGVIDTSNPERRTTHVLPLEHVEMIRASLTEAGKDPEISLDITASGASDGGVCAAVISGPAAKVRAVVSRLAALDPAPRSKLTIKTRKIEGDGAAAARLVNDLSNPGDAAAGRAYATLDRRTNTVIVSGPESAVEAALAALDKVMQGGQNAVAQPPATKEPSPGRGERLPTVGTEPVRSSADPGKMLLDPRKEQLGG